MDSREWKTFFALAMDCSAQSVVNIIICIQEKNTYKGKNLHFI